jgi:WD40 repeat protein
MRQKPSTLHFVILILLALGSLPTPTRAIDSLVAQTPHSCNPKMTIWHVVVSQSGKYLAANWGRGVRIWNIETGSPVNTVSADPMQSDDEIAISPDDKYVLTGGKGGVAILWDMFQSSPIYTFQLTPAVHSVVFLPDNKTILTVHSDKATLWDIETGKKIRAFSIGYTERTQVSSNGHSLLLRATRPPKVDILDLETGDILHSFEAGYSQRTEFSPDGKYIMTGHEDGYRIWDAQSYQQIQFVDRTTAVDPWGFSPNGKYWYGLEKEDAILIFDVQTGKRLHRFNIIAFPPVIHFLPDGKRIFVSKAWLDEQDWDVGGTYSVYDLTTGAELDTISINDSPSNIINSRITPDGKYLVAAAATYNDVSLRQWDLTTGTLVKRFC